MPADVLGGCLVPVGELDVPSFLEMARLMAQRIPNWRHVVIPGVGHMSNLEAPVAVNEILRGCMSAQ